MWWTKLGSSDMDEFYIILPEMSIIEGRKLLNYIYCGVDFGDNVLEEFLDVNDNSDEKKKRIKRSFCLARGRLVSIKILIVLG